MCSFCWPDKKNKVKFSTEKIFVVFLPKKYSFKKEALSDDSESKEETSKESHEEKIYKETGKESKKEITIKKIIKR